MRFRTPDHEPLEINLIPLIDVLLVMLIFLAATTTFMRQQALTITLPQGSAQTQPTQAIELSIHESGRFAINAVLLNNPDVASLTPHYEKPAKGNKSQPS